MTADKKSIFLYYWRLLTHEEEPIPEYCFAPPRKWRFDYYFLPRVAVEVEGGIFIQGRHVRGLGYSKDLEKYNTAAAMNILIFRFTPAMLQDDPEKCIRQVLEGLFTHQVALHRLEISHASIT